MANPESGNDAKGLMTVDAGASGNVGVTRMGWTASWTPTAGMSVLIASCGPSITCKWNTVKAAVGSHSVAVQAVDALGNGSAQSFRVTKKSELKAAC